MPSLFTHAVAACVISACFYKSTVPKRVWVIGTACSLLPDVDVWVPFGNPLRGLLGTPRIHALSFVRCSWLPSSRWAFVAALQECSPACVGLFLPGYCQSRFPGCNDRRWAWDCLLFSVRQSSLFSSMDSDKSFTNRSRSFFQPTGPYGFKERSSVDMASRDNADSSGPTSSTTK